MRTALVAAALLVPAVASAQTTVYSNDFESGTIGAEWSGPGTIGSTGGLSAFGFGASHLHNGAAAPSVLSLSGLASHGSMTLRFDLAMWDSIDWGDTFRVLVDGNTIFDGPFGNYGTPTDQCEGPGTRISEAFTSFSTPHYGGNTTNRDCARSVSFTFAHSASTAQISFAYPNTQTAPDESFGLDNVRVQTDANVSAVPEPGTYVLLATGLVAIAGVARRRRPA